MANSTDSDAAAALALLDDVLVILERLEPGAVANVLVQAQADLAAVKTFVTVSPQIKRDTALKRVQVLKDALSRSSRSAES